MPRFHPLTAACIALAITAPIEASAQSNDLISENYQQADSNGDGLLVYEEFATFIDLNAEDGIGNASKVKSRGLHAKAFERVDGNADGVVTPEELKKMRR